MSFADRDNARRTLALAVLPLLLFAVSAWQTAAQGPFWHPQNQDPAYIYLMNGLSLAQLRATAFFDHPGTPLHAWCAIVIRAVHLVAGRGQGLVESVVAQPETYLAPISLSLRLAVALALFVLGLAAARGTGSLRFALLCQSGPFWSELSLASLRRVSAEPLLLVFALLLLAGLLRRGPDRAGEATPGETLALGALAGLGIATKVTFFPMVLVPLFLLPGRSRLLFSASAALAFLAALLPIWGNLPRMFGWFQGLATHNGIYGAGEPGLMSAGATLSFLRSLPRQEPGFVVLSLLAAAESMRRLARGRAAPARVFATAAGVALAVQWLLVLKHPGVRYFVPSAVLLGPWLAARVPEGMPRSARERAGVGVLCLSLLVVAFGLVRQAGDSFARRHAVALIDARIAKDYASCSLVQTTPAGSPAFALYFGNGTAGSRFTPAIAARYPGTILKRWPGTYFLDGIETTADQVRGRASCLVVRGTGAAGRSCLAPFPLLPVVTETEEDLARWAPSRPACE